MRRLPALLALMAALPALAFAQGSARPNAGAVTIHRGSVATAPSPVPVHRGHAAARAPAIATAEPAPTIVVGGGQLWLVAPDTGRLTGCRVVNTANVGQEAIRCTSRRLRVD